MLLAAQLLGMANAAIVSVLLSTNISVEKIRQGRRFFFRGLLSSWSSLSSAPPWKNMREINSAQFKSAHRWWQLSEYYSATESFPAYEQQRHLKSSFWCSSNLLGYIRCCSSRLKNLYVTFFSLLKLFSCSANSNYFHCLRELLAPHRSLTSKDDILNHLCDPKSRHKKDKSNKKCFSSNCVRFCPILKGLSRGIWLLLTWMDGPKSKNKGRGRF